MIQLVGPIVDRMNGLPDKDITASRERHLRRALQHTPPPALVDRVDGLIEGAWAGARVFVDKNRARIEALADHLERQPDRRLECKDVYTYLATLQTENTKHRRRARQ